MRSFKLVSFGLAGFLIFSASDSFADGAAALKQEGSAVITDISFESFKESAWGEEADQKAVSVKKDRIKWAIFDNLSYTDMEFDDGVENVTTDLWVNMLVGTAVIDERFAIGLGVAFDWTDEGYSNSFTNVTETGDTFGYWGILYLGVVPIENVLIDFLGLYGAEDYDGTWILGGTPASYSQDYTTYSGKLGAHYTHVIDKFDVNANVSVTTTVVQADQYTDTLGFSEEADSFGSTVGEISLGFGYTLDKFRPFANVGYSYNFSDEYGFLGDSLDRNTVTADIGIDFRFAENFTATLNAGMSFVNDEVDTSDVSINLRYDF